MRHLVEKGKGRKYVGLPEFAQTAARMLSELDLEQERGTVTNVPDERTIRYYLAEGLIQTPEEKQGTASVFGYLHLLQLIAVKKLQAEHLPIRKIRELVAGRSERELETLIGFSASSTKGGPLFKTEPSARRGSSRKGRESEAKQYLESLLLDSMSQPLFSRSEQLSGSPAQQPKSDELASAQSPQVQESDQTQAWHRVEIEPGLELHVRSDYTPPKKIKSLAEKLVHRLRRFRRFKE